MSELRAALRRLVYAIEACPADNLSGAGWAIDEAKALLARPEPAPTYTVNPAPDAAAPMSPGKTFTAVATYTGMPFSRPEPEPRITREEAIIKLDGYFVARKFSQQNPFLPSAVDALRHTEAACLSAMLRSEQYVAIIKHHDTDQPKAVIVPAGQSLNFDAGPGATRKWLWPYLGEAYHLSEFIEILPSPPAASDGEKP